MLSPSRVAVVLASTALLVLGLDYVTFAATGQGLFLGHGNHAQSTTTVTNTGPGPALRLKRTQDGGPALAVDSDAKIRHLNADKVDGVSAERLGSNAVTLQGGQAWRRGPRHPRLGHAREAGRLSGQHPGGHVRRRSRTPRRRSRACAASWTSTTLGSNTRIFVADSDLFVANFPAFMSGAAVVRIGPDQRPGLVCTTSANDADFTLFSPVKASFTRLASREVKRAAPAQLPAGASPRLFGG